ncbi:MAG TPA: glycoside hydrolase family 172 protein, partial [Vicinamibacteria bacterium]|nr:glycoside hydrolase family 172 protein [Vicinamibacteria bacterium]
MHRTGALAIAVLLAASTVATAAAEEPFDGLGLSLGSLARLSKARTRSISPENFTGEKGRGGMATEGTGAAAARELGRGWKVSPSVRLARKSVFVMADVQGQGAIQHIWMTPTGNWRYTILRFYWDGEATPSVEVPLGDFFASGWGRYAQISSLPVAVNPGSAFNSYWEMPFRRSFRITAENLADEEVTLYYQVTYALTDVPADAAYFHAQFRRTNPLPYKEVYTILEGVQGWGQ